MLKGEHVLRHLLIWDRAYNVFLGCILCFKGKTFVLPNGSFLLCYVLRAQDDSIWKEAERREGYTWEELFSVPLFSLTPFS